MNQFFDLDKVKLAVDNNRLTALLCAAIDAQGGTIILNKEQAERVWKGAEIEYHQMKGGGISMSLRGTPVQPESDPDEQLGIRTEIPPIRQGEV